MSTTEARKKDRFSSSCRKFAAWRASRKPKWNQNQLQSQVLIQFHSFRVHDLWWSIFKNIHFRDDDTKCYHFSFLSSILNSILCDFWTIRSTRALRARRKGSRKKKKCIKKRERRKRRIFVESARLEAASVPISVRSCDGISEKRFTQRDRTRGDGLAEISLENSTIAHLPALIRSPPMVLWLIEWGIFNFRSTLPLTPSACTPPPVFARRHPHHHPHTRASAALIRVCVCVCVRVRQHRHACTPIHTYSRQTTQTPPPITPYLPFSNKASYYGITPFATRHNVRFLRDITPVSFVLRHFIIPPLVSPRRFFSSSLSLRWDNVSPRDTPRFIYLRNIRGVFTAIIFVARSRSKELEEGVKTFCFF